MNTIETRVIENKKSLEKLLPKLRPVMFKPHGKLCGTNRNGKLANAFTQQPFSQWIQSFNQYGK